MLPASTRDRKQRDISKGKQDGRGVEIQRLIGRSLRVVVDFKAPANAASSRLRRARSRRRHPLRLDQPAASSPCAMLSSGCSTARRSRRCR